MGGSAGAGGDGSASFECVNGVLGGDESRDWPEVVYNFDPDPDRHISSDCVPAIRAIREFQTCRKVEVIKLHGSFSGALVVLAKPFGANQRQLPSSVLKFDKEAAVLDEAAKTEEHGKAFGPTYPKVHDIQARQPGYASSETFPEHSQLWRRPAAARRIRGHLEFWIPNYRIAS